MVRKSPRDEERQRDHTSIRHVDIGRQPDRQPDGRTQRQTDKLTDRLTDWLELPSSGQVWAGPQMWSPTFWKQQLRVPSRHSHTHTDTALTLTTRTRSFPARTPRLGELSSSSDGPGTDLQQQWASHLSLLTHPARPTPIQLQSDAGTCRSLMATRPAVVEGISTQKIHSPFHRGTTRHIHTDTQTHRHTHTHTLTHSSTHTRAPTTGQTARKTARQTGLHGTGQ